MRSTDILRQNSPEGLGQHAFLGAQGVGLGQDQGQCFVDADHARNPHPFTLVEHSSERPRPKGQDTMTPSALSLS